MQMKHTKSAEEELEDFIWGRIDEDMFINKVLNETDIQLDSLLRRVQQTEETLNKYIKKGVEQNLPKLFDQATALEELERTQRVVDAEVNEIFQRSNEATERFGTLSQRFQSDFKQFEKCYQDHKLISDVHKCVELMDAFEKRTDVVKRSEIVLELELMVKLNPQLTDVIKDLVMNKLKMAQNQVRSSAAADLRKALVALNASAVANAIRALLNLRCLNVEIDALLTRSIAEIEAALDSLNQQSDGSRSIVSTVNLIQSSIEQASMLGEQHLCKFSERISRLLRSRLSASSPHCLKFLQQMSRILGCVSKDVAAPMNDALRPIRKEILNQGLIKIQNLINEHNFTDSHSYAFVDLLHGALLEEQERIDWDSEMHEGFLRNVKTVLDNVAARLEKEIKLDPDNLLLGDWLLAVQQLNYRLLGIGGLLASKWEAQAEKLKSFVTTCLETIFNAVRKSILAIISSMHNEPLGGREVSPYMAELLAYLERIGGHCAHLGPVLRVTPGLGPLIDYCLLVFLAHATLVNPMTPDVRAQLARDATRCFDACSLLHPSGIFGDSRPLAMLFVSDDIAAITDMPGWLLIQQQIALSDASLKRPHESVKWSATEYVEWIVAQTNNERYEFLANLMSSYTASVVSRGGVEFIPTYPIIMNILNRSVNQGK